MSIMLWELLFEAVSSSEGLNQQIKFQSGCFLPPAPDFSGPCPRAVVTATPWQGGAGREWSSGAAGRFLGGWEEVMMGPGQEELSREPGKQQEQAGVIR